MDNCLIFLVKMLLCRVNIWEMNSSGSCSLLTFQVIKNGLNLRFCLHFILIFSMNFIYNIADITYQFSHCQGNFLLLFDQVILQSFLESSHERLKFENKRQNHICIHMLSSIFILWCNIDILSSIISIVILFYYIIISLIHYFSFLSFSC